MQSMILLFAILVLALSMSPMERSSNPSSSMTLFDFESPDEASWQVVNDGVMGGRSKGFFEIKEGTLRFSGTLVTQGGGFTSIRAARSVDLTGYDGVELRIRGNGRTFEVGVDDGTRTRSWGRRVSRRAPFDTGEDWTWVRVPFSSLGSTVFGRLVQAPDIDLGAVQGFSLFIVDGIDGPFALEIDEIRAYQGEED